MHAHTVEDICYFFDLPNPLNSFEECMLHLLQRYEENPKFNIKQSSVSAFRQYWYL